jgi:glucose-1-phosphate adenylyltransferase
VVAIFGSDHIYRMDVSAMVDFHAEAQADVTVAALPVSIEEARSFGVIETARDGRILRFEEKPALPAPIPADPLRAFASMGNYVFSREALVDALLDDARKDTDHDFGRTIIPEMVPAHAVYAYDYAASTIPGLQGHEERGYWRDVGTIGAYWQAHMDLLGPAPRLDLTNPLWPILTSAFPGPSARIIEGHISDALVGEGSRVERATLRRSILGRGVLIEPGAVVEESIVMDYTIIRSGARLRRTIADRYNVIERGVVTGEDPAVDADRYHVDASGIVVIPRGQTRF